MSAARRKVSLAKVFGITKEEAAVPLPLPVADAITYATRNGYGPLVSSRIIQDRLELTFENGTKASYRPDRRRLLATYGSPELATVVARHGWAEQLRLTAAA